MATTKIQLDHLKESMDTKINFQTNFESSFTRQISALDSKFVSKTSNIDLKLDALDLKISALQSQMNSKFDTIGVKLKTEMVELETRLVLRIFLPVSVVLISLCPTF